MEGREKRERRRVSARRKSKILISLRRQLGLAPEALGGEGGNGLSRWDVSSSWVGAFFVGSNQETATTPICEPREVNIKNH